MPTSPPHLRFFDFRSDESCRTIPVAALTSALFWSSPARLANSANVVAAFAAFFQGYCFGALSTLTDFFGAISPTSPFRRLPSFVALLADELKWL